MRIFYRKLLKKPYLLLGVFGLLMLAIPLTLSVLSTPQQLKQHAAAGTSLSLIPQPGPASAIQKAVGDIIPIDLMIDPGNNAVTMIRLQIKYDPAVLQPVPTAPFTPTSDFPTILDGPVINSTGGIFSELISVGSDTSKAIKTAKKIGTFNFKAIGPTQENTPTSFSFTTQTQAYSSSSNDQASENILTGANPATITITTITTSPTVPPLSGQTTLSFDLLLHGIGSAGDNPNPTGNSLSNKNPRHPEQNLVVSLYDASDTLVLSQAGTVTYDASSGTYRGQIPLGINFATGSYSVRIKSDRYLRKLMTGVQTITQGQDNPLPTTELIAGDTNNDNTLNLLDYNALLDCGYGDITPLPVTNSGSSFKKQICQAHAPALSVDNDDNGIINSFDYNLFLRELSVQTGDTGGSPEVTPSVTTSQPTNTPTLTSNPTSESAMLMVK